MEVAAFPFLSTSPQQPLTASTQARPLEPSDTFEAGACRSQPVAIAHLPRRPARRTSRTPIPLTRCQNVAAASVAAVLGAAGVGALMASRSGAAPTTGLHAGVSWPVAGWAAMSALVLPLLMKVTAPYGRHAQNGSGPQIPSRLGWILMEAPAAVVTAGLALTGRGLSAASGALLGIWQLHYINRAFIYPCRTANPNKPMPVSIAASALVFNAINGYFNGQQLAQTQLPQTWAFDPRFVAGLGLFAAGFAINQQADDVLLNLRKPGETAYKIPRGGMYEYVSCPNYLGEIMEWTGWALASWSLPGVSFAMWTVANLLPRALAHHRWYKERFADYPAERKAILPGIL